MNGQELGITAYYNSNNIYSSESPSFGSWLFYKLDNSDQGFIVNVDGFCIEEYKYLCGN